MKRLHEKGEVATILAISAIVVIGISMISSAFLGGKKQTTSSKASAASCEKGETMDQGCAALGCPQGTKRICTCHDKTDWSDSTCECKADATCPGGAVGTGGGEPTCKEEYFCEENTCLKRYKNCSREIATDVNFCAGKSCGPQQTNPTSSQSQGAGGQGSPTCPVNGKGGLDNNNACNPACCESDGQCPGSQKCDIPNGFCKSGKSCNANQGGFFHKACVSNQCVNQPCPGNGACADDCASCGGGGSTTAGTTPQYNENNLTKCPGAENTWVPVNEIRGGKRCCAAKYNPKNDTWAWATWSETDKCKDGMPVPAGTTTNTPTGTTTNCVEYGQDAECTLQCPQEHAGWSCTGPKKSNCCAQGVANPTQGVPTTAPTGTVSPTQSAISSTPAPTTHPAISSTPGPTAQPTPTLPPSGCKWDALSRTGSRCVENNVGSCAGSCVGDGSWNCQCVRPSPTPSNTPTPTQTPTRFPTPTPSPVAPKKIHLTIVNNCYSPSNPNFTIYWYDPGTSDPIYPIITLNQGKSASFDITDNRRIVCSSWGMLGISQANHLSFWPIVIPVNCDSEYNIYSIEGGNCPY